MLSYTKLFNEPYIMSYFNIRYRLGIVPVYSKSYAKYVCVCVCVFCSLNVSYNGAGDRGLCELAKALRDHNSTLTHLFIWGNSIATPTADVSP